MKVINFWGGPGSGKSTTASGLFNLIKSRGHKAELTIEYAKELTFNEDFLTLSNQLAVLAEQDHRLYRLKGKVDLAITDSPLLLGMLYGSNQFQDEWFYTTMRGAYSQYDNVNVFVKRVKPFMQYGRNQNEDEARAKDTETRELLARENISFIEVDGDTSAPEKIYNILFPSS